MRDNARAKNARITTLHMARDLATARVRFVIGSPCVVCLALIQGDARNRSKRHSLRIISQPPGQRSEDALLQSIRATECLERISRSAGGMRQVPHRLGALRGARRGDAMPATPELQSRPFELQQWLNLTPAGRWNARQRWTSPRSPRHLREAILEETHQAAIPNGGQPRARCEDDTDIRHDGFTGAARTGAPPRHTTSSSGVISGAERGSCGAKGKRTPPSRNSKAPTRNKIGSSA